MTTYGFNNKIGNIIKKYYIAISVLNVFTVTNCEASFSNYLYGIKAWESVKNAYLRQCLDELLRSRLIRL